MPIQVKFRAPPRYAWLNRLVLYSDVYLWLCLGVFLDVLIAGTLPVMGLRYGIPLFSHRLYAYLGAGTVGQLLYRVCLLIMMVLICEEIGRRRPVTGRRVADFFAVVCWVPVVVGVVQMVMHLWR